MNTAKLKAYAPKARTDFIAAVSKQAAKYGVSEKAIHPVEVTGDICVVNGNPYPASMAPRIKRLVERVGRLGFEQTMEQVAYSWFNRLVAIRYMELHDYLGHGRRVLSHQEHPTGYQILDECTDITYGEGGQLPHLSHDKVVALKLDGSKDEELYRELLLAQCHALHQAMPFLFEPVDDETELLLPANLTKTDSLIHDLITDIPEDNWTNIEIIGWLYQFYISEKKDQVIGKVVKSEDIPAATQLFTPNWIVKYMVQNSLGAQWLATYPDSPLKGQMEYYIEPAEQTDEVNEQLKAITPASLNPEELTLIDPASGSGHILVEAYELFKAIYLERGYRQRDVPQLILEKNLFGLDIDERAAQLTGFALMMKGRADDRRLFEKQVKLNVMALQDSAGFDAEALAKELGSEEPVELIPSDDLFPQTSVQPTLSASRGKEIELDALIELKQLFEHATTFGSLIQVPKELAKKLPELKQLSEKTSQDLFVSEALKRLAPLVQQAQLLGAQYDAVVANPPYMGGKGMNALVKTFAKDQFPNSKSDLFACFMERSFSLLKSTGHTSMVTMQSWMFLSSFQKLRQHLLREKTIRTLTQIGFNSFPSMNSKIAMATVFSTMNVRVPEFRGAYRNLNRAPQSADKQKVFLAQNPDDCFYVSAEELQMIPGAPIAYWVTDRFRELFSELPPLTSKAEPRQGLATGDNAQFLRNWYEVSVNKSAILDALPEQPRRPAKWFPCNKGGEIRKWYGNNDIVVNWENDGRELHAFKPRSVIRNERYYLREGITWGTISLHLTMRYTPPGFLFETKGAMCFAESNDELMAVMAFANSPLVNHFLLALSPTLDFHEGPVGRLPYLDSCAADCVVSARTCARLAAVDWDAYERSWDFQSLPILTVSSDPTPSLESSYTACITQNREIIVEMKLLEEENNRLFIDAYGLQDELTPVVPIEQITLTVNPAYRYGGKLTEEELWIRFREDTMEELVSYAIGCMMGRYSLDVPGLIYANSGNEGFAPSRYRTFPADNDGIIPLTDAEWYVDDAANRVVEFIAVAWNAKKLEENLNFLAANLSPKKGENSRDTIRSYLCERFYKDHMQTYKKRPIYWLFSSGKQKAFQGIVYLHRYNEGTLSRMRTEYVIPLTAKISAHIDKLDNDKSASGSASEIKKLEKEIQRLQKQQIELTEFDEKLKHFADQRIKLDLDDGVKVNYGKFGDLLAEVIAIHGEKT